MPSSHGGAKLAETAGAELEGNQNHELSVGWVGFEEKFLRRNRCKNYYSRTSTKELVLFSNFGIPVLILNSSRHFYLSTRSRHLFRELLSYEPSLVRISLSSKIQHDHGIFLINIRGRRRISFNTNNPTTCHR